MNVTKICSDNSDCCSDCLADRNARGFNHNISPDTNFGVKNIYNLVHRNHYYTMEVGVAEKNPEIRNV